MVVQPYTEADLERGRDIVQRLHAVKGFDEWAEIIAKALAAERDRTKLFGAEEH